jgi:hypothetical protein
MSKSIDNLAGDVLEHINGESLISEARNVGWQWLLGAESGFGIVGNLFSFAQQNNLISGNKGEVIQKQEVDASKVKQLCLVIIGLSELFFQEKREDAGRALGNLKGELDKKEATALANSIPGWGFLSPLIK